MLQTADSFISDLFKDYAEHGFLPDGPPLTRLPNPYYEAWESIASELPTLIQTRQIRQKIDELPVCSTEHLATEAEWRRAYVIMGYFTHGYVWGGDKPQDVSMPRCSSQSLERTNTLSSASSSLDCKAIPGDSHPSRATCLRYLCRPHSLELQTHAPRSRHHRSRKSPGPNIVHWHEGRRMVHGDLGGG